MSKHAKPCGVFIKQVNEMKSWGSLQPMARVGHGRLRGDLPEAVGAGPRKGRGQAQPSSARTQTAPRLLQVRVQSSLVSASQWIENSTLKGKSVCFSNQGHRLSGWDHRAAGLGSWCAQGAKPLSPALQKAASSLHFSAGAPGTGAPPRRLSAVSALGHGQT